MIMRCESIILRIKRPSVQRTEHAYKFISNSNLFCADTQQQQQEKKQNKRTAHAKTMYEQINANRNTKTKQKKLHEQRGGISGEKV